MEILIEKRFGITFLIKRAWRKARRDKIKIRDDGSASFVKQTCQIDISSVTARKLQIIWLSLLHNFIQLSLNLGFAQVRLLLAACRRFAMVIRLNAFSRSTIPQNQFTIIIIIIIIIIITIIRTLHRNSAKLQRIDK